MKRKTSISHDETIIRRLRKDPDFAAEYLKAALEDEDEPRVLLIALRHLAQAQGIDRKSTRLNSSHVRISYAVFCLKKKTADRRSPLAQTSQHAADRPHRGRPRVC